MIAPILDEIAAEHGDKVTIAKLNVDDNPDLAMRFNVMSIPTLLVFDDGEVQQAPRRRQGQGATAPGARRIPRFLPLTLGQHGDAIRDLQRRLGAAGFAPGRRRGRRVLRRRPRPPCARSSAHRGLHDHGRCDEPTWLALVEASWRLGDRLLRCSRPNLRGDDVGTLQSRLGRLGFDCGRVDGILGPATARALEDFQRNCGLDVDGVCGPATVRALEINGARTGTGPGVAAIRELEQLGAVGASLRRAARRRRPVRRARAAGPPGRPAACASDGANGDHRRRARPVDPGRRGQPLRRHRLPRLRAARPTTHVGVAYYATAGFESAGGRSLAERIARCVRRRRRAVARCAPAGCACRCCGRRG